MEKREYNSIILKVLGSAEVNPKDIGIFEKRCNDEGDVTITLVVGVEAVEDKQTHTEGKFDKILKVKISRLVEVKET